MHLPKLKELFEKTRYEKEKGEKFESPFEEYSRIIQPYIDKDDIFLFGQYSDVPKLGIYPSSKYKTPIGIYSYPLIYLNPNDIKTANVPFAHDRKYIVLFTVKSSYRNKIVIIDDKGNISDRSPIKDDFFEEKNKEKLKRKELYGQNPFGQAGIQAIQSDIMFKTRFQTPFGIYWNLTRNLNFEDPRKWAQELMKDGVYGVIDEGSGLVHPSEPLQASFFSKEALQLISIIKNPGLKSNMNNMLFDKIKKATSLFQSLEHNIDSFFEAIKNHDSNLAADPFFQKQVYFINQIFINTKVLFSYQSKIIKNQGVENLLVELHEQFKELNNRFNNIFLDRILDDLDSNLVKFLKPIDLLFKQIENLNLD